MQFNSTGGIFLRLDASGNLTVYDSTGNVVAKFLSGNLSTIGNFGSVHTSGVISSTTSTSDVFTGNNVWYTPQISTKAVILLSAFVQNTIATDGTIVNAYRNTGQTNFSGGVAASGVGIGLSAADSATALARGNISCIVIDTGLTVGTNYTYSLAMRAITGGTASINLATATSSFMVYEF